MNLCIYILIYLYSYESMYLCLYIAQRQTHVVFLFQRCFHLIDRLRNIFKKHSDIIYTIIYYTIVYYSILYCSISNIRIQQRLLANDVPGDTHNLQRLTGYQFSSDRYYILCYCQQYISGYDFNHLLNMFQKKIKVTLRMIALFECSSQ